MNAPNAMNDTARSAAVKCGEPVPIACTLDAGARGERVEEWRALVATSVVAVESDASSVRLLLRDSDDALLAAASLGAREKACCAFFDVTIEIEPASRVLRLSVPEGAEEALAFFAALLRS
jgi:hypothetical protein